MKSFSLKNITFTKDEVIINKKKKQIKCPVDNIKQIKYTRITFINFLLAYFSTGYSPGWFQISFKNRVGRIYGYVFFVKYSDLKKLPKEFLEKVTISLFKNYLGKETRWYQKVGAILSVGSSLISTYNSIFGEPQYEEWIVY